MKQPGRTNIREENIHEGHKQYLLATLCAEGAGVVSISQASLPRILTAIIRACEAFELTVPEKKTGTMSIITHKKENTMGR